jgi:hypothetical protein
MTSAVLRPGLAARVPDPGDNAGEDAPDPAAPPAPASVASPWSRPFGLFSLKPSRISRQPAVPRTR